jgi:AraC-like DNA-binding protein
LLSLRQVVVASLGAEVGTYAVVHSRYRVHVVVRRNVVCDDALFLRGFGRKGASGRPVLTALLGGRARIRAFDQERWLVPGDLTLVSHKSAIEMRQEPPYVAVAIEWDPGALGAPRPEGFSALRASAPTLDALRAFAGSLPDNRGDEAAAARGLAGVLMALRADGVPFAVEHPDELREPIPEQTRTLSRTLDELYSSITDRPMIVDLDGALGLSSRQVNRIVSAFNERFGFNAGGWRDTRNRWRLFLGVMLMTAPGASAEKISLAVGYSSTATFTRALSNAALPVPSAIADAVRALGGGPVS